MATEPENVMYGSEDLVSCRTTRGGRSGLARKCLSSSRDWKTVGAGIVLSAVVCGLAWASTFLRSRR